MTDRPGKAIVVRQQDLPAATSGTSAELSVCPSCGRTTKTVGEGTCADCWQPKTEDGRPAIAPQEPRTLSLGLLEMLDDVPDLVWVLIAVGALAALVRIAVSLFS